MKTWLRVILALVVPLLSQQADAQSRHLNKASSFDTTGLENSRQYQNIYRGQFDQLDTFGQLMRTYFVQTAMVYAQYCRDAIAADSPSITVSRTTRDGWGNTLSASQATWLIDSRFHKKVQEFGPDHLRAIGAVYAEARILLERNGCVSAPTMQYLENLLRWAHGRPPVQREVPEPLPRYSTMGSVSPHPVDSRARLPVE
jgi:hypothetical protein